VERVSVVDVNEIMVTRGGGWDANQLAGRFGDAARTGGGWTASPARSLIRAQNSDWVWCGDATAMPENLPVATTSAVTCKSGTRALGDKIAKLFFLTYVSRNLGYLRVLPAKHASSTILAISVYVGISTFVF
jgi:hypothetical protein